MDPRADRRAPWVMESRIRHRRGVASTGSRKNRKSGCVRITSLRIYSNEEVANKLIDLCLSGCLNTTSLSYFNE